MDIKNLGIQKGLISFKKTGSDLLLPVLKEVLKFLHIPNVDICCPYENIELPVSYNNETSKLNFYNPTTEVLQELLISGGEPTISSFETLLEDVITTWDFNTIKKATVILTDNRTLDLINTVDGDTGLLKIKQDAVGNRSLILPGQKETGLSFSISPNNEDILGFINVDGTLYWSISNFGNVSTTPLIEYMEWVDPSNVTLNGSGTLTGNNTTTPAGARATKKLASNGYVEFNVGTVTNNSAALVLLLDDSNDTNYVFGAGNPFKIGLYHTGGNIFTNITHGATSPVNRGALGTYKWLRMEQSTNDVLIKASVDGITYTTLATVTGALTGITDVFVKAAFVTNSGAKVMTNVKGTMISI